MSESAKTFLYVLVGGVFVLIAWVARPTPPGRGEFDDRGELFFADFEDPLTAATLEILRFDEETGTPRVFKVARHEGVWSIPSHENYAADAQNKFGEAVSAVIGLKKGPSVSDRPADHAEYGVIDPRQANPGASGVGKRVTFASEGGRTLGDLIIGKPVKETPGQRYVRSPGVDRVYLAQVYSDKFSTNFGDWIE